MDQLTEVLIAKYKKHSRGNRPFIVGIDGLGGAGKTTIARKLKLELEEEHCETSLLHIDDYINKIKQRYQTGKEEWFEYYFLQWDVKLLQTELFDNLHNNKDLLTLPFYQSSSDTIIDKQINVEFSSIILVEGIFLQRKEWRDYFDFVIYVDCSHELRAKRVLERDLYIGNYRARLGKYKRRYWVAEDYYFNNEAPIENADYIYLAK